jgi:hypothetical protein
MIQEIEKDAERKRRFRVMMLEFAGREQYRGTRFLKESAVKIELLQFFCVRFSHGSKIRQFDDSRYFESDGRAVARS